MIPQSRLRCGTAKTSRMVVATAHLMAVRTMGETSPTANFPATALPPQNNIVHVSRTGAIEVVPASLCLPVDESLVIPELSPELSPALSPELSIGPGLVHEA